MLELNKENFKDKAERDRWKRLAIMVSLMCYVLITIMYFMYVDIHKQDEIIKNQNETIYYVLGEVLK